MIDTSIEHRLNEWSRVTYGAGHSVRDVGSLGGHSGITIGFDVVDGDALVERLVLKMPPPGVARKNNFDVLRQVPLLRALEANSIPAPRACYWSEDENFFDAPFLMMSRLAGRSPPDLFRDEAAEGQSNSAVLFNEAVDVLARMHAIDPGHGALADWGGERGVDQEIEHWAKIFHKTENREWLQQGHALRDLLHETKPARVPHGLTHGDYYSNNWVFDGAHLSGVVDWEGASIGPCLLDMGWLYMIYDRECWGPSRHRFMDWQPHPPDLLERYRESAPPAVRPHLDDIDWYRALAAYRIASITAYYFEEHRSGRRPNAAWEMFGEAFSFLMQTSERLLNQRH